jgi:hypothetical protein
MGFVIIVVLFNHTYIFNLGCILFNHLRTESSKLAWTYICPWIVKKFELYENDI